MHMRPQHPILPQDVVVAVRGLIAVHQSIYRDIPPQGIFFEKLVEEAFRRVKRPLEIFAAFRRVSLAIQLKPVQSLPRRGELRV